MPKYLSEIKEVHTVANSDYANQRLKTGNWILLDVKIVETSDWWVKNPDHEAHLHKEANTLYVLGRVK